MSDEKQYTERDLILAKRAAVVDTIEAIWDRLKHGNLYNREGSENIAKRLYPFPKVMRPRVVKRADGCQLRIVHGQLWYRWYADHAWQEFNKVDWSDQMREAMLDLLANPTEEVDA